MGKRVLVSSVDACSGHSGPPAGKVVSELGRIERRVIKGLSMKLSCCGGREPCSIESVLIRIVEAVTGHHEIADREGQR